MGYITDVKVNGASSRIGSSLYGTCSVGAGEAIKTVILTDLDSIKTGLTIHVKFYNTNTALNPQLQVGGEEHPIIRCQGEAPGNTPGSSWMAGSVVSLTFDGNNWAMNDVTIDEVLTQREVIDYVF